MIVHDRPNKDFTVIRNDIMERRDVSLAAKGLWVFLMTKPEGWQTTIRGLASQLKEGRDAIATALKELESIGLYTKERRQRPDGTYYWKDYVYGTPRVAAEPCPDNPDLDEPDLVTLPQVNTEEVSTDEVKTDTEHPSDVDERAAKAATHRQTPDPIERAFEDLNRTLGGSDRVLASAGRLTKLKRRLTKFPLSDLLQAAEAIAANPFMMGDNPNGRRYGNIDYLLRNDETIDRWLDTAAPQREVVEFQI